MMSHWSALGLFHLSQANAWITQRTSQQQTRSFGPAANCQAQDGVRPSADWRRARGRPPTTWIHQICRDTGIPVTDRRSGAGRRQIVLATNRNGGIPRLNTSRHDHDDDDDDDDDDIPIIFMHCTCAVGTRYTRHQPPSVHVCQK